MPRRRRQGKIPTPAWERPRGALGKRVLGRSFQFYGAAVVALLVAVAIAVVGYAFANDYVEKQRRPGSTAIQLDDTKLRLDYFSRRLKMYVDGIGGQGSDVAQPTTTVPAVSEQLIQEEVVRRFAEEFKLSAGEDEVNEAIAARIGVQPDDANFGVAFQQELGRSELSEDEYRRMVEASVLSNKLRTEFESTVAKTAESAHYRQIIVSSEEKAQEIRDKLDAAGDFADLAAKESLDGATKDTGGDVGWVPRGVLDASLEELIFALEPKEVTTIPVAQGVYIIEMLEKDDAHEVEESQKGALISRAILAWIAEKRSSVVIVNHMDLAGGDSKKIAWAVKRAYSG